MKSHGVRLLLTLFIFLATAGRICAQEVVLGVLEDVPGVYSGEANSWRVRAMFHKTREGWQVFPTKCSDQSCLKSLVNQYPAEIAWTVGFDGKILGKVTAQTPKDFGFYGHIGLQNITAGSVPTVGKRSSEFSSDTLASVYRPLVANSRPYFKDPEQWKPVLRSGDLSQLLREQFRKKFPRVSNCRSEENVRKLWRYRDEDIKIGKAYSSNKGWSVAPLRLAESRCDFSDDAFLDQWFAVLPERQVLFLGAQMVLVDAADYDNDGKSELLFSIFDENLGGYRLFYDEFRKSVDFKFFYH